MATILPDPGDNEAGGSPSRPSGYPLPMAVMDVRVHRLTVEDYLRLVADGEDGRWDRTELVEGVIYDVSPESAVRADTVTDLSDLLRAARPDRIVRIAGSVQFSDGSLWEPDVYVLRADLDRTGTYRSAVDVELVVEVSVSTLSHDLGVKYRGYARAGIPEYWVVVPGQDGYLLRHRSPERDGYTQVIRFELGHDLGTVVAAALA